MAFPRIRCRPVVFAAGLAVRVVICVAAGSAGVRNEGCEVLRMVLDLCHEPVDHL
jgi:hypothetical protein